MKIRNENLLPAYGKDGKSVKHSNRLPCSNITNKSGQKGQKLSSCSEVKKPSKGSGFRVFEDEAPAAERAGPSRSVALSDQQTQTGQPEQPPPPSDADRLVADMCTAGEPSDQHWRLLAESRQQALEETLQENEQLHERLSAAQEEIRLLKEVVQQAESVMAAVQEWSEEKEQETEGDQ